MEKEKSKNLPSSEVMESSMTCAEPCALKMAIDPPSYVRIESMHRGFEYERIDVRPKRGNSSKTRRIEPVEMYHSSLILNTKWQQDRQSFDL
jgi:hypothetical protein